MQEFKLIVAGGRDYNDYDKLSAEVFSYAEMVGLDIGVSIVSGMARGADMLGRTFALREGVALHEFPADWETHGKAAGFIRNRAMAEASDGLLAFWDGHSRGTAHMIQTMRDMGKPVHIVRY